MRFLTPGRATMALVALTLIWGYSWVTSKMALQYAAPFAFATQRAGIGAATLFAALIIARRSLRLQLGWQLVLYGLVQTGLLTAVQSWALIAGGAGKTAVLMYTAPVWTLLLAWPLLGERVRGSQWLAAAATLTGLTLIISPWNLDVSPLAMVLGVASALCWSIATILVKRMGKSGAELLLLNAWQMAIGTLFLIAVVAVVPEPATRWTGEYVGLLGFTAVITTGLGWYLWLYILERLPAWEASLSLLGVPVVAIISSRLQLGEMTTGIELAGMLLIGTGLALLSLVNWRQQLGSKE